MSYTFHAIKSDLIFLSDLILSLRPTSLVLKISGEKVGCLVDPAAIFIPIKHSVYTYLTLTPAVTGYLYFANHLQQIREPIEVDTGLDDLLILVVDSMRRWLAEYYSCPLDEIRDIHVLSSELTREDLRMQRELFDHIYTISMMVIADVSIYDSDGEYIGSFKSGNLYITNQDGSNDIYVPSLYVVMLEREGQPLIVKTGNSLTYQRLLLKKLEKWVMVKVKAS